MRLLAIIVCFFAGLAAAFAVEPDEILDDPVLEARARAISAELRCPKCQNENIDASNADVAQVMRIAVRERLVAGDTDEQVIDYMVERYGEFVLFRPRFSGLNAVLWLAGPALLIIGAGAAFLFIRRRAPEQAPAALSAEEQAELSRLMDRDGKA